MILKLMQVGDLPDTDPAKAFTMLGNVDKVEKMVYEWNGELRVDLYVMRANPSRAMEETITLQANAYLMNDAGKTIESILAFPGGGAIDLSPEAIALPIKNEHLGELLADVTDVNFLQSEIAFLWKIIDDIDTVSDAAKHNDKAYRASVERLQNKRHLNISSDGRHLYKIKK